LTRRTLNLGILAHVDAGKTTLTERLLYAAGVIGEIGSVDAGTTQTDSLALERQRGITIKSAVVSFAVGGVTVNLIDTPGHPDFIAEVERVLSVLDGAVLVISAVEGVQPQARVLMRALRRLRIPALLFVNKIDRTGAGEERVLRAIAARVSPAVVPMGSASGLGTRAAGFTPWAEADADARAWLAEILAERDEGILAAYIDDELGVPYARLRQELAGQTRRALVYPVFLGSAATGAGVPELMAGLTELLPAGTGDAGGPVSGRVFKIERGAGGEKLAYVRMFSGTIRTRDRVDGGRDKVTAINVFEGGAWVRRDAVRAGEIGKLWGLAHLKVGDALGKADGATDEHHFAPPTLEAVVEPVRREDHVALRSALTQLAEQDPLINVRDLAVSLYGEVQKEVIQATLADDFGIEVRFQETTPLYIERPTGTGEAVEILNAPDNPFRATIGLRVERAPADSGVTVRVEVDFRTVPLFVYRSLADFTANMDRYVRRTLDEGLHGWPVRDCVVTLFRSEYSSPDGPPATRGPLSTAADFRKLTPLVLMRALERAGATVCEPMTRVRVDGPAVSLGPLLGALGKLGTVEAQRPHGDHDVTVEAVLPATAVRDLHRELPSLTSGEGTLDTTLAGYRPVRGDPPSRPRTMANPLNREEYLASLSRQ
jgi:ribosomal protection tetracycline resistance protein